MKNKLQIIALSLIILLSAPAFAEITEAAIKERVNSFEKIASSQNPIDYIRFANKYFAEDVVVVIENDLYYTQFAKASKKSRLVYNKDSYVEYLNNDLARKLPSATLTSVDHYELALTSFTISEDKKSATLTYDQTTKVMTEVPLSKKKMLKRSGNINSSCRESLVFDEKKNVALTVSIFCDQTQRFTTIKDKKKKRYY